MEPIHNEPETTYCKFCREAGGLSLYRVCNCDPPLDSAHTDCLMNAIRERIVPAFCPDCKRNYRGVSVIIKKPSIGKWCKGDPRAKWDLFAPASIAGYLVFISLVGYLCGVTNYWHIVPIVFSYLRDVSFILFVLSIVVLIFGLLKTILDLESWRNDQADIRVTPTYARTDSMPSSLRTVSMMRRG